MLSPGESESQGSAHTLVALSEGRYLLHSLPSEDFMALSRLDPRSILKTPAYLKLLYFASPSIEPRWPSQASGSLQGTDAVMTDKPRYERLLS